MKSVEWKNGTHGRRVNDPRDTLAESVLEALDVGDARDDGGGEL